MWHKRLLTMAVIGSLAIVSSAVMATPASAALPTLEEVHVFNPDNAERAGYTVDLSNDYALYTLNRGLSVGVSHRLGNGNDTWETAVLERPGGDGNSYYGVAVALNETADTAFVSAPREQKIYRWTRSGSNTWALSKTYDAPTTFPRVSSVGNTFAEALAYSDGRLLVGAPNATVDGQSNVGATYVLDVSGNATDGDWKILLPPVGQTIFNGIAGQSLAIDGSVAIVGIPQRIDSGFRVGGIYRYDLSTDAPPTLLAPTPTSSVCFPSTGGGSGYGISVAMSDGVLVVGSPQERNSLDGGVADCTDQAVLDGDTALGAVYRYDYNLNPIGSRLLAPVGQVYYGLSVAVSGERMMASTSVIGDFSGRLIIHDMSAIGAAQTRPTPTQVLVPSDSAPSDGFGSNIYGQGPAISGNAVLVGASQKRSNAGTVYYFRPIRLASTLTIPDTTVEYGQESQVGISVTNEVTDAQLQATFAGTTSTVPLSGGNGTVTRSGLNAGQYPIEARYVSGEDVLATGTGTHTVTKAPTSITVQTVSSSTPGSSIMVQGTLTAPYGPVAGVTVTLEIGGSIVTATTTAQGTYQATVLIPASGEQWPLTASFAGDRNHLSSSDDTVIDIPGTTTPTPSATATSPTTSSEPTTPGSEPTAPLPNTGASVTLGAIVVGCVLVVGGMALSLSRRRH